MRLTKLAVLLASATLATAANADTIKIGVQPWLGYGPLWIAEQKGFFEAEGLEVELVNFNSDADMNVALVSGSIQVSSIGTNSMINMINAGADMKGFLILDAAYGADAVIAGAGIESIEDLRGKQVAFEQGATSDLLINFALREAGMSIADITPVQMAASDAGLAAIAGRVDAAVSYEPYISTALKADDSFSVIFDGSAAPGLISDLLAAETAFIESNADDLAKIARAWDAAVTFIRENPTEGGQIIADAVGADLEEFTVAFEGVHLYDLAENLTAFAGPFIEAYDAVGGVMVETNPTDTPSYPAATEALDLSITAAAAAQ